MKSDLDVKCIEEPLRDVLIGIWFRRFENNLFSRASWQTLMVDGIKNLKYPDLPIAFFHLDIYQVLSVRHLTLFPLLTVKNKTFLHLLFDG